LVVLKGVTRRFGGSPAVDRIDLDIRQGEVFALLGASGCGKSTTLRMIAGLEPLDEGTITMAGRTLADARTGTSLPPERRNIAIVFQSYAVWPHMTVAENVEFPLKMRHVRRAERRDRVARVLEITGMQRWAGQSATSLSGGQQQRVALARALVYQPDLLLLDEPLSNLDSQLRAHMRREIRALNEELGVTMLFVTHDQDEAFTVADRVGVMANGRLEQVGTPVDMYEHPKTPYVRDFLGRMLSVEGTLEWSGAEGAVRLDFPDENDTGVLTPLVSDGVGALDGQRVKVFFRPEDVEIVALGFDRLGRNQVPATVLSADYLGDHIEYKVDVRGSEGILAAPRGSSYKAGDAVVLRIDPSRATVWGL
jgi:ABC-type Fe3+/spermidine/putrescine transport system ATPase subunit